MKRGRDADVECRLKSVRDLDGYDDYLEYIHDIGARALPDVGTTQRVMTGTAGRGIAAQPLDVWCDNRLRTTVRPVDVLHANIASEEGYVPPNLTVTSDGGDMRQAATMSLDYLKQYPLHGWTESGQRFKLFPGQVLLIDRLCRGVSASTLRAEVQKERVLRSKELTRETSRPREADRKTLLKYDKETYKMLQSASGWNFQMKPSDDADGNPAFHVLGVSMGTGKTIVATLAGIHLITARWADCVDAFPRWGHALRRFDPQMPFSRMEDVKLTRTFAWVAPASTFTQIVNTVRAVLKPLSEFYGVELHCIPGGCSSADESTKDASYVRTRAERFSSLTADRATIMVVSYESFDQFLQNHSNLAVAAIAFDELATHMHGMRTQDVRPLAWRTWAVTATPSRISQELATSSVDNFVRTVLAPRGLPGCAYDAVERLTAGGRYGRDVFCTMDYLCRRIMTDVALPLRGIIAREAAATMPARVDIFNIRPAHKSLAVHMGWRQDDMAIVPWSFWRAGLLHEHIQAGVQRTGCVLLAEVRAAVAARRETAMRAQASGWMYDPRGDEFMRCTNFKSMPCYCCGSAVRGRDLVFSACCTHFYCVACSARPCLACSPMTELPPVEALQQAMPPPAKMYRWIACCMAEISAMGMSTRNALACIIAAAVRAGRTHVVASAQFPVFSEGANTAVRIQQMQRFLVIFSVAAPAAEVATLMTNDGHLLPRGRRAKVLEAFKAPAPEGRLKLLVLNDTHGKKEQVVGLDLGVAQLLVSVGRSHNPTQMYSRVMRASAGPRSESVTIVRLV